MPERTRLWITGRNAGSSGWRVDQRLPLDTTHALPSAQFLLALAVVTGRAPEPAPTPTSPPVSASDDEAFAAAEATARLFLMF